MLLREIILEKLLSTPAGAEFDVRNTLFFNILCANPLLARFYADLFRRHGANSSIIKDLETRSGIFFDPDQSTRNSTPKPAKGLTTMAINPNTRVCTHIKVNGTRCGSPALREEIFCYFHQRMIRGVRTPPKSRLHPIALLEDKESIQASLMEIINALVRNHIDVNRARLILRALYVAVKNAPHTNFEPFYRNVVTDVPEYPAAPPATGPFAMIMVQAEALAHINTPQQEESEAERIDRMYSAPLEATQRKAPSKIRKTARGRSKPAARRRDKSQPAMAVLQMERGGQECPPHTSN